MMVDEKHLPELMEGGVLATGTGSSPPHAQERYSQ